MLTDWGAPEAVAKIDEPLVWGEKEAGGGWGDVGNLSIHSFAYL